jgi:hypothetical protein
VAGNFDYVLGLKETKIRFTSDQASVFFRLSENADGGLKKTYPATKSGSAWEATVPNADIGSKTIRVAAYPTQVDADGENLGNEIESDTVLFLANKSAGANVRVRQAIPKGDPRKIIQGIFDTYFPADYHFKTGPDPVPPGKKNIFAYSGYSGPMDPPAGTSCGDVLNGVLQNLMGYKRGVYINVQKVAQEEHAWIEPNGDPSVLPDVGDPFVLFSPDAGKPLDNPKTYSSFAHVAFISSAPNPYVEGGATWGSVDGGGGLKSNGEQKATKGNSTIKWVNGMLIMTRPGMGEGNPAGTRRLVGWANLDVLFGYERKSKPADSLSGPAAQTEVPRAGGAQ